MIHYKKLAFSKQRTLMSTYNDWSNKERQRASRIRDHATMECTYESREPCLNLNSNICWSELVGIIAHQKVCFMTGFGTNSDPVPTQKIFQNSMGMWSHYTRHCTSPVPTDDAVPNEKGKSRTIRLAQKAFSIWDATTSRTDHLHLHLFILFQTTWTPLCELIRYHSVSTRSTLPKNRWIM